MWQQHSVPPWVSTLLPPRIISCFEILQFFDNRVLVLLWGMNVSVSMNVSFTEKQNSSNPSGDHQDLLHTETLFLMCTEPVRPTYSFRLASRLSPLGKENAESGKICHQAIFLGLISKHSVVMGTGSAPNDHFLKQLAKKCALISTLTLHSV
jgi:hypothetical protein